MRRENAELSRCGTEKTPEETGDRIQESGVREYGKRKDGVREYEKMEYPCLNRIPWGRKIEIKQEDRMVYVLKFD